MGKALITKKVGDEGLYEVKILFDINEKELAGIEKLLDQLFQKLLLIQAENSKNDPIPEDPVDEDPVDEDPVDEDPVDEDPVDEDPIIIEPEDDEDSPTGDITLTGTVSV